MSDSSQGEGWWQASDGKWYPPAQASSLPVPPAPPTSPGVPPAPAGPTPFWRRGWVLLLGAVLLIGGVAAIVISLGDDDDGDTATVDADDDTTTTRAGDTMLDDTMLDDTELDDTEPDDTELDDTEPDDTTPSTTQQSPTSTAPTPTAFTEGCSYAGVDDFGDVQVDLQVVNPLTSVGDISVTYALVDADDVRFVTSTAFFEAARPQERFRVQNDTFENLPARITDESLITCRILETEQADFGEPPLVPADAACEFLGLDFADDIQVDLTVSNPFEGTTDLAVTYALRGADGVRFDTSTAFVDVVAAGETVRVEEDTVTDVPSWVDESELSCEVLDVEDFGF